MASHSTSQLCSLCFCFPVDSLSSDINKKIEKYLQIKIEYSSASICSNCYNSVLSFHEFYERVHVAQKNFFQKLSIKEEAIQKTENNEESFTEPDPSEEDSKINLSESEDNKKNNFCKTEDNKKKTEEDISCNKEKLENRKFKSKISTFKEISCEIEKKMLEFYNVKCEKCEENKFTSFKMLSKHYLNVHNTQGYIKCCKRNIKVNDKYYLRSHMFKHLQPDICRCNVCGKELSSQATLKHHMILHKPTEERPFQCSKCDKRFCCKNDLKNHEKAIHLPENEREDFICDVCGKVFQKVANLRYHHSVVHLQEKKFICEVCAKCFTTQSGLRTHMNAAHSALNPIQCSECNKWLKTKDTYQKHLQLHQNNSYPCKHCSKVCNSSASLRSHLVKHSEERPYSCSICKKSFKTKTHLKNHSTQHLGGGNYKCPYCPKLFVNMSNYYTHRRRMHSSDKLNTKQEMKTKVLANEQSEKNYIYDYTIPKQNGTNSPIPPQEVPTVKHEIMVSPNVKFL